MLYLLTTHTHTHTHTQTYKEVNQVYVAYRYEQESVNLLKNRTEATETGQSNQFTEGAAYAQ